MAAGVVPKVAVASRSDLCHSFTPHVFPSSKMMLPTSARNPSADQTPFSSSVQSPGRLFATEPSRSGLAPAISGISNVASRAATVRDQLSAPHIAPPEENLVSRLKISRIDAGQRRPGGLRRAAIVGV